MDKCVYPTARALTTPECEILMISGANQIQIKRINFHFRYEWAIFCSPGELHRRKVLEKTLVEGEIGLQVLSKQHKATVSRKS